MSTPLTRPARVVRRIRELSHGVVSEDAATRQAAYQALGEVGHPLVVPLLLKGLQEKDWTNQAVSARALGNPRFEIAIPALKTAIQSAVTVETVKIAAAESLVGMGTPNARQALQHALRDATTDVQRKAMQAVGAQKRESFIPILEKGLVNRRGGWESVQRYAANALTDIGTPRALAAIERHFGRFDHGERMVYLQKIHANQNPNALQAVHLVKLLHQIPEIAERNALLQKLHEWLTLSAQPNEHTAEWNAHAGVQALKRVNHQLATKGTRLAESSPVAIAAYQAAVHAQRAKSVRTSRQAALFVRQLREQHERDHVKTP